MGTCLAPGRAWLFGVVLLGLPLAVLVTPATQTANVAVAAPSTTVSCDDTLATTAPTPPRLNSYEAITPERFVDTRSGLGGHTGIVEAGCTLRLDVSDSVVPDDAEALALSVTAVSDVFGFMTVFPCEAGRPETSNLNPRAGTPTPNLVVVAPDVNDMVCIYTAEDSHVIVDLQGWWGEGPNRFSSIEPERVYDTRFLPGSIKLPATHVRNIFIGGVVVPLEATAVMVNLTVAQTEGRGWLAAYPCGTEPPDTSNSNYEIDEARGVAAIVGLGVGGQLCVTTSTTTHVIVDVVGYYAPAPAFGPAPALQPLLGDRLVDSRVGIGGPTAPMVADEVREIEPAPGNDEATAVMVNVIGLRADFVGFLTLYPCGEDIPEVSTVNMKPDSRATNLAVIELSDDGTFCVYASTETDIVVDLFGVMAAPAGSLAERLDVVGADVWPSFAIDGNDYAVECVDGTTTVDLDIDPLRTTTVRVNGVVVSTEGFVELDLETDDVFTVTLEAPAGDTTYRFRCLPSDFPRLVVDRPGAPVDGWYLTTLALPAGTRDYLTILDSFGAPIWYKAADRSASNFELLDDGNFAYVIGGAAFGISPDRGIRITDSDGAWIDEIFTSNDLAQRALFPVDHHEQILLPNGDWALLTYPLVTMQDLTVLNQDPMNPEYFVDDSIVDSIIREVDTDGNLVWSWSAMEHFSYAEVTFPQRFARYPSEPNGGEVDVFHINGFSVIEDGSGDYMATARHLDAVFRIDRATSDVEWILGSLPSDPADPGYVANPNECSGINPAPCTQRLTIVDDPLGGPLRMHDVHLDGDVLTLFDNRSATTDAARAVAYEIDTVAGTATLLWSIEDSLQRASGSLGSNQVAADGSVLVDWGNAPGLQPMFEEFDASGERLMAIHQVPGWASYRIRKYPPEAFDAAALRADAGGTVDDPPPP